MSDVIDSGKPFDKEDAAAEEKLRLERLSAVLGEWQKQKAGRAEEDYHIGPDDVLDIEINSLEGPGTTSKFSRTVDKDGKIFLPLVDRIKVAGLTELGIRDAIRAVYQGRYLKDPQVSIVIKDYRSAGVVITGAVQKPGICYLQKDSLSVLDVLSMAGGLTSLAGDMLYISRSSQADPGRQSASNSLQRLPVSRNKIDFVAPPGLLAELKRRIGDKLYITESSQASTNMYSGKDRYIYVIGFVQRPGPVVSTSSNNPSIKAASALGAVGGLTGQGKADKILLIRRTEKGDRRIVGVDLVDQAADSGKNLMLQPGDILVVASDSIMDWISGAIAGKSEKVEDGGKGEENPVMDISGLQRLVVNLKGLIEQGDIRLNIPIRSGDIVSVPPRIEEYVYVLGYVQRPGPITIKSDKPVRALNALAMAGGPTFQGRAEKSYLVRDTEKGEKRIISIDLAKVARGVRPDVDMKPGDTLVIGSDFMMKMTEIIRPTISAGASVSAVP